MQVDEKTLLSLLADEKTQHKAFEILVRQYSEPLYRQIRRMVLYHDDADDVMQNTFIKAWKGLPTFEGRSKLSSWLYRITINEALDFLHHSNATTTIDGEGDGQSVAAHLMADEYFEGDEAEARLQEAIHRLPDVQRTVFQLKYYEDMKYSEISKILGTSEGALKASYHIAVKKISSFLSSGD